MDFIFEILFELILEGCIEVAGEKKVPIVLRVLCAVVLGVFYLGLVGVFFYAAIKNQSAALCFIAAFVALLVLAAVAVKYRKWKKSTV